MHEVVLYLADPARDLLSKRLFDPILADTPADFARAMERKPFLAFVDAARVAEVAPFASHAPIVAIVQESLGGTAELLERYPWLSHVISSHLLETRTATEHLGALYTTLRFGGADLRPFVGGVVEGRFTRLVHSTSRPGRVERLGQYFESKGVSSRKVHLLRDVAEELVTNAFYDAPAEARVVAPIERTQDVILTGPYSCELAYGMRRDEMVFVRVRDLFGSLRRERLISVLRRCAQSDGKVEVDGSMGGAGLGLWRIFSAASFVAISVESGVSCDILVGLYRRQTHGQKRKAEKESCAIHLFFDVKARMNALWGDPDEVAEEATDEELEKSVALRI